MEDIIFVLKKLFWKTKGYLANLLYGFPAKDLKIIGITGTNGKTTTCFFIDSIFQAANFKTARMTTVDYHLNDTPKVNPVHLTTFGPMQLQKFLSQAKEKKIDWIILELSSHGLAQDRTYGIELYVGLITYALREHIDFHKTVESYLGSKAKILSMIKENGFAVLNRDDKNYDYFKSYVRNSLSSFGILRGDVRAERIEYKKHGASFLLITPQGNIRINLALPGRFNVYNALAAAAIALGLGLDIEKIREGLEKMKFVPGRMEEIKVVGQPFRLIVDYVHTPDALALVLEELRQETEGKIIVVFGMPGERDPINRPLMGQTADNRADIVIITDENPRSETSESIIDQIASGMQRKNENRDLFKIVDRRQAIKKAISLAEPGDIVLIAGKGPENYMEFKDKTISWDDRLVSRQLLKKYFNL